MSNLNAFVSFHHKDKYFVELVERILEFHYINAWCCRGLEPGTRFSCEISKKIQEADLLLIVVSENSLESKWVTREVAEFRACKPDAKIVPLLIDDGFNQMDDIYEGLKQYHYINFREGMNEGFEILLNLFGKDFLMQAERRAKKDRRSDKDRRESPIIRRLRTGFWKCYESETGSSKFDPICLMVTERMRINKILTKELLKYEYSLPDKTPFEMKYDELDRITFEVWDELRKTRDPHTAVNVIEAIAEKIHEEFIVTSRDRRLEPDRRALKTTTKD